MAEAGVAGGRPLTDFVSLGVLASRVPREAVDEAVAVAGRGARRRGGKLPPHVVVYLVMALALFADEDYQEVSALLTAALRSWGCWGGWEPATKGAVTQARQRLGPGPLEELFSRVAVPVAGLDTPGAFLGPWRLVSIDGTEIDVPDTPANREAFGPAPRDGAFPRVRLVTVAECGSHAPVLAAMGPCRSRGSGEKSLARGLYPRLEEGWLLLADRGFFSWADWRTAAATGAELAWRVSKGIRLPVVRPLEDGSYLTVLVNPGIADAARRAEVIESARRGQQPGPGQALLARVVEYDVPDREGGGKDDPVILLTTITDVRLAPAAVLAAAYHQRWEHEGGFRQMKAGLRGPGRVLRSGSPPLAEQELWGYLLTHYAITALACEAATAAGIDPDRVSYARTLRIVRRAVGPAFPP